MFVISRLLDLNLKEGREKRVKSSMDALYVHRKAELRRKQPVICVRFMLFMPDTNPVLGGCRCLLPILRMLSLRQASPDLDLSCCIRCLAHASKEMYAKPTPSSKQIQKHAPIFDTHACCSGWSPAPQLTSYHSTTFPPYVLFTLSVNVHKLLIGLSAPRLMLLGPLLW